MYPNKPRRAMRRAACAAAVLTAILAGTGLPATAAAMGARDGEAAAQARPAIDGVLDLFRQKPIVALGDAHGLAQEEAFYSALVRDPRFAEQVGNVVVEFGGAASQDIVDRYVGGEDVPFAELRRVWTETVGFEPGPTYLGFVNVFASVRAANLKLPPERRIKVWLGDPKIDWSKVGSMQDMFPLLRVRDDSVFRILDEEILRKQKKTLLIIGLGHLFGPGGAGPLKQKITQAYPDALAIVSPFIGYLEPQCNAKVLARAGSWPTPALVGPIEGSWLKSGLDLAGCNYLPAADVERMKKMAANGPPPGARPIGPGGPAGPGGKLPGGTPPGPGGPPTGSIRLGGGKPPSPLDILAAETDILSGRKADALLYLGPPDTLTQSPIEPSIYLDPDYFKEQSRRALICSPHCKPLDWDRILQNSSPVPRKFDRQG